MHMWFWFGYDVGDLLFAGLSITSQWAFALTWIALFIIAVLFEASKVYLARAQRAAQLQFYPYRSDERRNLLCEREQQGNHVADASSTRDAAPSPHSRWATLKTRLLVTTHQTVVFISHSIVGYLLMLVVMVYNVHLLFAVVLGLMLGYFLFGTKLTRMQMQCFGTKRAIICTPECDDTAETSTPPLLTTSIASESDLFICRTRTCIQPSHYFPSSSNQEPTCQFGAKKCPSRVARARRLQASAAGCSSASEMDAPAVEGAQLLRPGCCQPNPDPHQAQEPNKCCSSHLETTVLVHDPQPSTAAPTRCEEDQVLDHGVREETPQVTCCHSKAVNAESQEQIVT